MGERSEHEKERQRGKRDHEIGTFDPRIAAARPIEERGLGPGRDGKPAEHDRLFPVEAFENRTASGNRQQDEREAECRAIPASESAREHEQKKTGERGRDMSRFDERQRNESFEQRQPGVERRRGAAQHDQDAASADEARDHASSNFKSSRRAQRDPRQQQQRGDGPRNHVVRQAIRGENRGGLAVRKRQVRDPERVAAAKSAGHEADDADRLAEKK